MCSCTQAIKHLLAALGQVWGLTVVADYSMLRLCNWYDATTYHSGRTRQICSSESMSYASSSSFLLKALAH